MRIKYYIIYHVGQNGWVTLRQSHTRDNGILKEVTAPNSFWKGRVVNVTLEDGQHPIKIYSPFGGGRDDTAYLIPVAELN